MTARESRHGHELERGHAQRRQMVQLSDRGPEAAFGRERADVGLVHHRFGPGPAAPAAVGPAEGGGVDHLARSMHVLGLEARSRVGHAQAVGQFVAVAATGPSRVGFELVPAVRPGRQRDRLGPSLQPEQHALAGRGEEAETHAAVRLDGRAEREGAPGSEGV